MLIDKVLSLSVKSDKDNFRVNFRVKIQHDAFFVLRITRKVYLCGKLLTMLTEKEKENFFKNIDMLTIMPDRYNGSSLKGLRFIAFMLDYYDLPDGWCGSDFEEREFWDNYQGHAGFGKTPNDAAIDLAEKLKEAGVDYLFID